jgi:hypothetical protein
MLPEVLTRQLQKQLGVAAQGLIGHLIEGEFGAFQR